MRETTRTAQPADHKAVRLVEQRSVERAQDEAFTYAADFSNIEDWDPGVVSSRRIGHGPVGVGTQFELEVEIGGGTMPMVYEITEYEPSDRVVLIGRGDKLVAVDEIRFSRHDNMTVIDYTADLTFLNWFRHVTRLMGPSLKKVGTKALDGLAAQLGR
jgi:hypothetical protein